MKEELTNILQNNPLPNYIHPFTELSIFHSKKAIFQKAKELNDIGVRSMNLLWSAQLPHKMMEFSHFDTPAYWRKLGYVIEACRKYGMTFMIQDAAPFPTGEAEGWFRKPEYAHLNKQYLTERHLDVAGPAIGACFDVDLLMSAVRGLTESKIASLMGPGKDKVKYPADQRLAVVAMQCEDGVYLADSAVDLTNAVKEGRLRWDVPDGQWRLFVIFSSYHGDGRRHYMNLLDRDSVRLLSEAVHKPHYEHLKEELGKTWLGFFYDETEVGNVDGYLYDATVGHAGSMTGESMQLPWCKAMPEECRAKLGENYRTLLPLLWVEDGSEYHHVRFRYMDIISRLIQENYNGQVYRWCHERGILYIGHNLEDENSHMRLACGPVHYFRMQAHQDMAGIDLIGGQIMPKKDFSTCWYGNANGDGEFYHYVLAKLASSAAHISPEKQKKSVCEVFAVYGKQGGVKLRKFVLDHLMVNGINNIIPSDSFDRSFDLAYNTRLVSYLNRMCHLMNHTDPIIQVALLYGNDGEWYQGRHMLSQKPAARLAQSQISYDIVPDDVFEDKELYHSDFSAGLAVNGNRYQALVIPETEALSAAVLAFVSEAKKAGFPVLYVGDKPTVLAENGESIAEPYGETVTLEELAGRLDQLLDRDLAAEGDTRYLRYNHMADESGDYFFLHNEGDAATFALTLKTSSPLYRIDMETLEVKAIRAKTADGCVKFVLPMAEYEAVLLYAGGLPLTATEDPAEGKPARALSTSWKVKLNGKKSLNLPELRDLTLPEYDPHFAGTAVYEATVKLEELPLTINFGQVEEACELFVNGVSAGRRIAAPYTFPVEKLMKPGANKLRLVVQSNAAHTREKGMFAVLSTLYGETYNVLRPCGLLGPVTYSVR